MRKAVFLRFSCMKKHPVPLLDKAGLHGYNIKEGRCYCSQTLIVSKFI